MSYNFSFGSPVHQPANYFLNWLPSCTTCFRPHGDVHCKGRREDCDDFCFGDCQEFVLDGKYCDACSEIFQIHAQHMDTGCTDMEYSHTEYADTIYEDIDTGCTDMVCTTPDMNTGGDAGLFDVDMMDIDKAMKNLSISQKDYTEQFNQQIILQITPQSGPQFNLQSGPQSDPQYGPQSDPQYGPQSDPQYGQQFDLHFNPQFNDPIYARAMLNANAMFDSSQQIISNSCAKEAKPFIPKMKRIECYGEYPYPYDGPYN